jgi:hypothetical protein
MVISKSLLPFGWRDFYCKKIGLVVYLIQAQEAAVQAQFSMKGKWIWKQSKSRKFPTG